MSKDISRIICFIATENCYKSKSPKMMCVLFLVVMRKNG